MKPASAGVLLKTISGALPEMGSAAMNLRQNEQTINHVLGSVSLLFGKHIMAAGIVPRFRRMHGSGFD